MYNPEGKGDVVKAAAVPLYKCTDKVVNHQRKSGPFRG
jgi:hypothetical protein